MLSESPSPQKPSARWVTTASQAMMDVDDSTRKELMVQNQKARRANASSGTSICFGNEQITYLSDTKEKQNNAATAYKLREKNEHANHMKICKSMKEELSRTNFVLGDTAQSVNYESTMKQAMKIASNESHLKNSNIVTARDVAKKSSIYFGNEDTDYRSEAQRSITHSGDDGTYIRNKKEVSNMKINLLKRNFTLGEEPVEYKSDYQRGFSSLNPELYRQKEKRAEMKQFVEETRRCHFVLGQDDIKYKSNAQESQEKSQLMTGADVRADTENARLLKQQLQKTSFIIGNDQDYW
jgi:hypothetical protein